MSHDLLTRFKPPGLKTTQCDIGAGGKAGAHRLPDGHWTYKVKCRTCWTEDSGVHRKWRAKASNPSQLLAVWRDHERTHPDHPRRTA